MLSILCEKYFPYREKNEELNIKLKIKKIITM